VELQQEVLEMARTLIQRHSLRAFEAIHLASALGLKERLNEDITLVAADDRLLRAALLNASIS
jgi:predicted nucleic acid-binding protein